MRRLEREVIILQKGLKDLRDATHRLKTELEELERRYPRKAEV
jgi:signal recognition particle subunit SEC65